MWTGSDCGFMVVVGIFDLWWLWVALICGGCGFVVAGGFVWWTGSDCGFVICGGCGLLVWDVMVDCGLLLTVIGDGWESMGKKTMKNKLIL